MAAQDFKITLSVVLAEAEPDGSTCIICDEVAYLKAWRYCVRVSETGKQTPVSKLICDSCRDLLR